MCTPVRLRWRVASWMTFLLGSLCVWLMDGGYVGLQFSLVMLGAVLMEVCIRRLRNQVAQLLWVDNGTTTDVSDLECPNLAERVKGRKAKHSPNTRANVAR
eukprot:SAG11_NODE_26845_length_340_cov_0.643154_1_plen_100_part_10